MDENWLNSIKEQVKIRNERECPLLVRHIYEQHHTVWKQFVYLEDSQERIKHKISTLEHETGEILSKQDAMAAVENFRRKISSIRDDLIPVELGDLSRKPLNLSKIIFDQRKLIGDQVEEIKTAKSELQKAIQQIIDLTEQVEKLKQEQAQGQQSRQPSDNSNSKDTNSMKKEDG